MAEGRSLGFLRVSSSTSSISEGSRDSFLDSAGKSMGAMYLPAATAKESKQNDA